MKISILKRLEAMETQVKNLNDPSPSMVLIYWNPDTQGFTVSERWYNRNSKGKVIPGYREKTQQIKQLNEYCILPTFTGVLILDTNEAPDQYGCNLFSMDGKFFKALRKQAGKDTGFQIQSISQMPDDLIMNCIAVSFP